MSGIICFFFTLETGKFQPVVCIYDDGMDHLTMNSRNIFFGLTNENPGLTLKPRE